MQWKTDTETERMRVAPSRLSPALVTVKWLAIIAASSLSHHHNRWVNGVSVTCTGCLTFHFPPSPGSGPWGWKGFLQNIVSAEEERPQDLSDRCQVLLRRWFKHAHRCCFHKLWGIVLFINKRSDSRFQVHPPVRRSLQPRRTQWSPCISRTMSAKWYWKRKGERAADVPPFLFEISAIY